MLACSCHASSSSLPTSVSCHAFASKCVYYMLKNLNLYDRMQFNLTLRSLAESDVSCQSRSTLTAAHVSFPPFICMWDRYFAAQHHVMKDSTENIFLVIVMIVMNRFLPLAPSRLTVGHLLKKANKPARNLPVPAKGWDLIRHPWNVLRLSGRVWSWRISKVVLSYVRLARMSTAGTRLEEAKLTRQVQDCSSEIVVWLDKLISRCCVCCTQFGGIKKKKTFPESICNPCWVL